MTSVFGQNEYELDSLEWSRYLDAAFHGSHDSRVNKNKKISSPNGACKIAFMNIQHRMNGKSINPNDLKTQEVAMDMSQMENAFYDFEKVKGPLTISPVINGRKITLKNYFVMNNRDSLNIGIVDFVSSQFSFDSIENQYFAYAFSVGAGYHLFHLLSSREDGLIRWYLFDDFGLNGQFVNDLTGANYLGYSMGKAEVSKYLWKYVNHAAYIYQSSENINNSVVVNGVEFEQGDRPLWSKVYRIKK